MRNLLLACVFAIFVAGPSAAATGNAGPDFDGLKLVAELTPEVPRRISGLAYDGEKTIEHFGFLSSTERSGGCRSSLFDLNRFQAANREASWRRSAIACFGCTPMRRSMSFPSLKMSMVGMLAI